MKNCFYVSLCLFLFVFISCKNNNQKDSHESNNKSITNNISITDSIQISHAGLIYEDKLADNLLFYNPVSYDVAVYNLKSKRTSVFNKSGDGFDEYTKIYKNFITFRNDSVIAVSDIKSIKQYNLKGEFLGDIKFDTYDNAFAPLTNLKFYGDSLLIGMKSLQGNPSKKEYYKENRKVIFVKNLNTGEEDNFINFPEELNDFFEEEYYYSDIYSYADLKKEKSFYFVNSNGKVLYEFDVVSKKLNSISLPKIPCFKILKLPFGKKLSQDDILLNLYRSSSIEEIFKDSKNTFIVFGEGYDKEYLIDFKKKNKGFPFTVAPNINYSLFRFNENSHGKLYRLNKGKNLFPFYWDEQKEEIYMLSLNNEFDELNGVTTLYKGKLN